MAGTKNYKYLALQCRNVLTQHDFLLLQDAFDVLATKDVEHLSQQVGGSSSSCALALDRHVRTSQGSRVGSSISGFAPGCLGSDATSSWELGAQVLVDIAISRQRFAFRRWGTFSRRKRLDDLNSTVLQALRMNLSAATSGSTAALSGTLGGALAGVLSARASIPAAAVFQIPNEATTKSPDFEGALNAVFAKGSSGTNSAAFVDLVPRRALPCPRTQCELPAEITRRNVREFAASSGVMAMRSGEQKNKFESGNASPASQKAAALAGQALLGMTSNFAETSPHSVRQSHRSSASSTQEVATLGVLQKAALAAHALVEAAGVEGAQSAAPLQLSEGSLGSVTSGPLLVAAAQALIEDRASLPRSVPGGHCLARREVDSSELAAGSSSGRPSISPHSRMGVSEIVAEVMNLNPVSPSMLSPSSSVGNFRADEDGASTVERMFTAASDKISVVPLLGVAAVGKDHSLSDPSLVATKTLEVDAVKPSKQGQSRIEQLQAQMKAIAAELELEEKRVLAVNGQSDAHLHRVPQVKTSIVHAGASVSAEANARFCGNPAFDFDVDVFVRASRADQARVDEVIKLARTLWDSGLLKVQPRVPSMMQGALLARFADRLYQNVLRDALVSWWAGCSLRLSVEELCSRRGALQKRCERTLGENRNHGAGARVALTIREPVVIGRELSDGHRRHRDYNVDDAGAFVLQAGFEDSNSSRADAWRDEKFVAPFGRQGSHGNLLRSRHGADKQVDRDTAEESFGKVGNDQSTEPLETGETAHTTEANLPILTVPPSRKCSGQIVLQDAAASPSVMAIPSTTSNAIRSRSGSNAPSEIAASAGGGSGVGSSRLHSRPGSTDANAAGFLPDGLSDARSSKAASIGQDAVGVSQLLFDIEGRGRFGSDVLRSQDEDAARSKPHEGRDGAAVECSSDGGNVSGDADDFSQEGISELLAGIDGQRPTADNNNGGPPSTPPLREERGMETPSEDEKEGRTGTDDSDVNFSDSAGDVLESLLA